MLYTKVESHANYPPF